LPDPIWLRSGIGVSSEDEAAEPSNGAEAIIGRIEEDLPSAANVSLGCLKRDFGDMQFRQSRRTQVPKNRRGAINTIVKQDNDFEAVGIQRQSVPAKLARQRPNEPRQLGFLIPRRNYNAHLQPPVRWWKFQRQKRRNNRRR
jgi:hypothetical protein